MGGRGSALIFNLLTRKKAEGKIAFVTVPDFSQHEGNYPPAPAAMVSAICNWKETGKKDSGYGSQGILKFDSVSCF